MPERKVKVRVQANNKEVVGSEVPIIESTERFTELSLEDGTVVRIKPVVMSAIRVDGQYDQAGNPVYVLQSSLAVSLSHVPEHMKKEPRAKGSGESKVN